MIVHHIGLNNKYNVNCNKLNLSNVCDLKRHLTGLINGIYIDNIRLIKNNKEVGNSCLIDFEYINMIIVPIKCNHHK
jgi:hypothetical protein